MRDDPHGAREDMMVAVGAKPDPALGPQSTPGAYDSLFQHSLDCVKLVDADGCLLRINHCGCEALEICQPSDAIGECYFEFWSGGDEERARAAAAEAARTGSGRFTGVYTSQSGKITYWDEVLTAIRAPDGSVSGYLIISRDVTDITRGLAQQRALAELGSAGIKDADFGRFLQVLTETMAAALDVPLTKVLQFADDADELILRAGVGWKDGLVGAGRVGIDHDSQAGYTLLADEPVVVHDLETETRFSGPPLLREHGVRSGVSAIIAGVDQRPFGVLGIHTDRLRAFTQADVDFVQSAANIVAARWRQECAERDQRMLLREMAHRSGNLLQVADAIFRQSLEFTPDVDEARRNYSARLGAMARSSMSIARSGWDRIGLRALATDTLSPFIDRINLSGRDIVIDGALAFDIGMVWHELATNSAKYGALNNIREEVDLSWSLSRQEGRRILSICWRDSAPTEAGEEAHGGGFGSRLMSQIVELKREGEIEVVHEPVYKWTMRIPLAPPRRL